MATQHSTQPAPRIAHSTTLIGDNLIMWGGDQKDLPGVCSSAEKDRLCSVVDVFPMKTGRWQRQPTSGTPPRGVAGYSSAALDNSVIYFGGYCGHEDCYHNDITILRTERFHFEKIMPSKIDGEGPMQKGYCGMVCFTSSTGEECLHTVGGYGTLPSTRPHQFKYTHSHGNIGWTNEEHIFSLKTSKEERRL